MNDSVFHLGPVDRVAAASVGRAGASGASTVVAPLVVSTVLHVAMALGAMEIVLGEGPLREARVDFRQGVGGEAREVRLTLVMLDPPPVVESPNRAVTPPIPPAEVKSQSAPLPPEESPREVESNAKPAPSPQAVTGQTPGETAEPEATLPGRSPDADSAASPPSDTPPVPVRVAEVPAPASEPAKTSEAADPVAPGSAATADQSPRVTTPDHLSGVPSLPAPGAPPAAKRAEPVPPTAAAVARGRHASPSSAASRAVDSNEDDAPAAAAKSVVPAAPPVTPESDRSDRLAPDVAAAPAPAGVTTGIAILHLPEPRYPLLSVRAGEEGTIVLEFEVLPDGRASRIRVIRSPGFPRLENAAIDAVRKARFEPALRQGRPVAQVMTKTFQFVLADRQR